MIETISLNGSWQLGLDPERRGKAEGWAQDGIPEGVAAHEVRVPSVWNVIPGLGRYTGVAYYQRELTCPEISPGEQLRLRFEAVNHSCEVWFAGERLGAHTGGYMPFEFDLSAYSGRSGLLVVRVVDYPKEGEFEGVRQADVACAKESWYYTYGGIYQDVSLVRVPDVHVAGQVIAVDPATGDVKVRARLRNVTGDALTPAVRIEEDCSGREVFCETLPPVMDADGEPQDWVFRVETPNSWSPATPFLYRLKLGFFKDGEFQEYTNVRFGFRTFELRGGRFYLNGEEVIIKGGLLQPNYPLSLVVPQDAAMARREICLLKEAGFNLVRSHVRPADPAYLDMCDEIGLLVHQETPCGWIENSELGYQACLDEMTALYARDQHHASIVMWGILNENFSVPEKERLELLDWSRKLDPTRPCIDDSGIAGALTWERLVWVDQSWSMGPGQDQPEPLEDHHHYPPVPLPPNWYKWLQQLGDRDQMAGNECLGSCRGWREKLYSRMGQRAGNAVFMSETGYGGFPNYDEVLKGFEGYPQHPECEDYVRYRDEVARAIGEAGLDWRATLEQSQVIQGQGMLRMIEAMRSNPMLSGYVITQVNDAAWEHFAGFLDCWRQPKESYVYLKTANQDLLLLIDGYTPVGYANVSRELRVKVVNDTPFEGSVVLHIQLSDGEERWREEKAVALRQGIQELGAFSVPVPKAGCYVLSFRLSAGGEVIAERTEQLVAVAVTKPDAAEAKRICLVGADEEVRTRFVQVLGQDAFVDDAEGADVIVIDHLPLADAAAWQPWVERCWSGARVMVMNQEPPEAMLETVNVPFEGLHDHDFPCEGLTEALGCEVELRNAHGFFLSNNHYLHEGGLTNGLPAGGLLDEAYAGVTAGYGFVPIPEAEVMGGAFCQRKFGDVELKPAATLMKLKVGSGQWCFCQFRLREFLGRHPYMDQLLLNLL